MNPENNIDRYKREQDSIVVEIAVKNTRQLFNERDPAPFRERDLDSQFVTYLVSTIEEFAPRTKIKIKIHSLDNDDLSSENSLIIKEAIHSYFRYESQLAQSRLKKSLRTARFFSLIGVITLFVCLSLSQLITATKLTPVISEIISAGLVIIGWVGMWRPIESLLYDWWPIREQRLIFDKISKLDVEVVVGAQNSKVTST
jgi:hypothetical protein